MITAIEYALMAGASYISNRPVVNRFPIPDGWLDFFHVPDPTTASIFPATGGFEAISFQRGNEIVISYESIKGGRFELNFENVAL
jgi:hypothetical protein